MNSIKPAALSAAIEILRSFGCAKSAGSCTRSTSWIAANHKRGRRFRIGSWQSVSADARGKY
jgi:hypothetical protein